MRISISSNMQMKMRMTLLIVLVKRKKEDSNTTKTTDKRIPTNAAGNSSNGLKQNGEQFRRSSTYTLNLETVFTSSLEKRYSQL